MVSQDLVSARDTLIEKRELKLIMRTNAKVFPVIHLGDLVQIHVKKVHEKRGKWLSNRIVQILNASAGTVSVPGSHGNNIISALEDVGITITEDDLATQIIESIDKIDHAIFEVLDKTIPASESSKIPSTDNKEIIADAYFDRINSRSLEVDHISATTPDVDPNSAPEYVENPTVDDLIRLMLSINQYR